MQCANFRDFLGTESLESLKPIVYRVFFAVICYIFALIAEKGVWNGHLNFCTVIVYIKMHTKCDFEEFS